MSCSEQLHWPSPRNECDRLLYNTNECSFELVLEIQQRHCIKKIEDISSEQILFIVAAS